jgi:hypothetical protein
MDSIPEGRGHPVLNFISKAEEDDSYVFIMG